VSVEKEKTMLDLDSISRLILEKDIETVVLPRESYFLNHLNLGNKGIFQMTKQFGNINEIINAKLDEFSSIIKSKDIKEDIMTLVDQILDEKVIL